VKSGIDIKMDFPKKGNILKVILELCRPQRVVLFGSRAKGRENRHSAIDLFVECENMNFREKRKLREAIDNAAGIYSVDIVFSDEASEELKRIIEEEGVEVWKRQR